MRKSVANFVISQMRLKAMTVKGWAEANNHKPDTVYKIIHGTRGKQARGESAKIINGLKRDGFWPAENEAIGNAANH